jgi:hypothetical protein
MSPLIQNGYAEDPLGYCIPDHLNSQFLHPGTGRTFGKYSKHCAEFMAGRCATAWDGICEAMSHDPNANFPDMTLQYTSETCARLTAGQRLVRDSAYKKYKLKTFNCNLKCEPFDPTVANSPMVCYETSSACTSRDAPCLGQVEGGNCYSEFGLRPEHIAQLDSDPIMNRLLDEPFIAPMLLRRLFMHAKQNNQAIEGTRFYAVLKYQ